MKKEFLEESGRVEKQLRKTGEESSETIGKISAGLLSVSDHVCSFSDSQKKASQEIKKRSFDLVDHDYQVAFFFFFFFFFFLKKKGPF